eukprot:SM000273S10228  [mRNA]  locus=s273:18815:28053:+ [translate_table: standard]
MRPSERRGSVRQDDEDIFHAQLAAAGLHRGGDGSFLAKDPLAVGRQLEQQLQDEDLRETFVRGLHIQLADESSLLRLLAPITGVFSLVAERTTDESSAAILLRVPSIQVEVSNALLEKLPEYLEETNDDSLQHATSRTNLPVLIVSQFLWLEHLSNSSTITQKLLEILPLCHVSLKKEIIAVLPDIAADADQTTVLLTLEEMLHNDPDLTVSVIEAFSKFDLGEELLEQAVAVAMTSLRSANIGSIPKVTQFLLQCASSCKNQRILHQLRATLGRLFQSWPHKSRRSGKQKEVAVSRDAEHYVIQILGSQMNLHQVLCSLFLKEVKEIGDNEKLTPLDILLLIMVLHASPGKRTTLESIMKNFVLTGQLTEELLAESLEGNGAVLSLHLRTILDVCEMFLGAKEDILVVFGCAAYFTCYITYTGTYERQEILGSLITHTGSMSQGQVEGALEVLSMLARKCPQELLPFAPFINGIIDYLDSYNCKQLEKVYDLFCTLAVAAKKYGSNKTGGSVMDDVMMLISKQSVSVNCKYQKLSILGALGLLCHCGADGSRFDVEETGDSGVSEPRSEATQLQQILAASLSLSPPVQIFLFDGLARVVAGGECDAGMIRWQLSRIQKNMLDFEGAFLGSMVDDQLTEVVNQARNIAGEHVMNLDHEHTSVTVRILSLLREGQTHVLNTMPAQIHLFTVLEAATNKGSLENLLTGKGWRSLGGKEQELICLALYYAINWLREIINAFASQQKSSSGRSSQAVDTDISAKLLKRIRNLVSTAVRSMEHLLKDCMNNEPIVLPQLNSTVSNSNGEIINSFLNKRQVPECRPRQTETRKRNTQRESDDHSTSSAVKSNDSQKQSSSLQASGTDRTRGGEAIQGQGATVENTAKSPKEAARQRSMEDSAAHEHDDLASNSCDIGTEGQSDLQSEKWRPLSLSAISLLSAGNEKASPVYCCPDPHAQLPIYLCLLKELDRKLSDCPGVRRWLVSSSVQSLSKSRPTPPMDADPKTCSQTLLQLQPMLPSLRGHLDCAASTLQTVTASIDDSCDHHWHNACVEANTYAACRLRPSPTATAEEVTATIFRCLSKLLSCPAMSNPAGEPVLRALLDAFACNKDAEEEIISEIHPPPVPGSMGYAFCGMLGYLRVQGSDAELNCAVASTSLATKLELLSASEALRDCASSCERNVRGGARSQRSCSGLDKAAGLRSVVGLLRSNLGTIAEAILKTQWEGNEATGAWKGKANVLRVLLRVFIRNQPLPLELLLELATNVMPQVRLTRERQGCVDELEAYPSLSRTTFLVWYRVQIKEMVTAGKANTGLGDETVTNLLGELRLCISIHVALVLLTRAHVKISVHAMAVKSVGNLVNTFLKGMDFLETYFEHHKDTINLLLRDLQKSTRTAQTICSEAKGQKSMPITTRIPGVKRIMERLLFRVKAMYHASSHASSFGIGNLKHKDLQGRIISSQLPSSQAAEEEDVAEETP